VNGIRTACRYRDPVKWAKVGVEYEHGFQWASVGLQRKQAVPLQQPVATTQPRCSPKGRRNRRPSRCATRDADVLHPGKSNLRRLRLTIVSRDRVGVRRLLPMGRNLAEDENKGDSRVSVRTWYAAAALILIAVPFALLLALVQARWVPLRDADLDAASDLHGYAVTHSAFVTAMRTLSTIGSYRVWTPVLSVLAVWLCWRRQPRLALFVAVTAIGSSLINNLVKSLVDRARPILAQPVSVAHGFSFPSSHAQAAVVGYGILLVIFLPMLRGAVRVVAVCGAVLMIAAIGFSRIALGVHYLSDVLAGYVLGAAWLAAMVAAFGVARVKPRQRPHSRTS
jgi:membrane-associated phospholipid phosphatase